MVGWRRAGSGRVAAKLAVLGLVAALMAGLAACSGGPVAETFDLGAPAMSAGRSPRGQLVIAEPVATLPVDSDRVVVRTGPEAVAYLTGAQWADRLPRLVQSRMIATFENSHALNSVGRPGLSADNSLISEIRRFEVDITTGMAIVELSVKLVGDKSGRIRAARIFTASTPAPAKGAAAMTAALDRAMAECMRQLVRWTVAQI